MQRPPLIVALAFLWASCGPITDTPSAPGLSASIADAAHSGNAHFYWLPPLVPAPSPTGVFDAGLSPVVTITEEPAGTQIAAFTMTTGPGSETVRVDPASEHYIVNWHTDPFNLSDQITYRIHVGVDGTELGHADVDVVSTGRELKNVDTQQFVALLDDRTLPIKFRIEQGALPGATCGFVVAAPTVIQHARSGVDVTGPFLKGDVLKLATSITQACFTGATVTTSLRAWSLERTRAGVITDVSNLLTPNAAAEQPQFTTEDFGDDYVARVALTDPNSNVSNLAASATLHTSTCGSAAPVTTLVDATQTVTVLQQLPAEASPVSDMLTVIQTPAEGPFAAPTRAGNTTPFPVPFYLNEGPTGTQHPTTVRVSVTDAPGTAAADQCPSFGYTAVGLLKPSGSGASASAVTPPTGTTLSNPAQITVSYAPDVGDVLTCVGPNCTTTPGNYAPTFMLFAGPASFLVNGPTIRAGGTSPSPNRNCGGNEPVASFTPPTGTESTVNVAVPLNASGTADADNAVLQLTNVAGVGPASTGCGFTQQLRFNWDAIPQIPASTFTFTGFDPSPPAPTPPPFSSSSATAVSFVAHNADDYTLTLTAGDGTGLNSAEGQNVYTASNAPTQPTINAPTVVTENTTGHVASVVSPKSPPWSYRWSILGDGTITSSILGTTITFTLGSITAGTSVTLSVVEISPSGVESTAGTASVEVAPSVVSPTIIFSRNPATVGNVVTASVTDRGAAFSYTWEVVTGPGVVTGTGANVTVTASEAGTVSLRATETNQANASAHSTRDLVFVAPATIGTFTVDAEGICPPATATFTGTFVGDAATITSTRGAADTRPLVGSPFSEVYSITGTDALPVTFTLTVTNAAGDATSMTLVIGTSPGGC